ncbi:MAG: helix-turn-helix domain-containing protein [Rhodothermaceae bacterium]|nr:helix-turn-helix domain-containing protein [Rhodothermaceae bacterium]
MKNTIDPKLEVGQRIRQDIIPDGMSVTEAAKRLGVSRPALSKLLNGRASLSPKMATRMQETFGRDVTELLAIQANAVPMGESLNRHKALVARNVPAYPTIRARDIEIWGTTNINARHLLPVLVRRLVQEAGHGLKKLDFPGYDNVQRHGFDGQVIADTATLNVPAGQSVWELSVQSDPRTKAQNDYNARLGSLSQANRAETTFVFVTTRNWKGKDEWALEKNGSGEWKDVRAYDASDLEQWLETTFALRIWLAERLGISTRGIRSIEACWKEWAGVTDPPMTPAIFVPTIRNYKEKFLHWLGAPPERPFTVAAESRLESVAFIACLFREEDVLSTIPIGALAFESVDALESLSKLTDRIIAVVYSEEVEHRIADAYRRHYCIVVRPKNIPGEELDIVVDSVNPDSFEKALLDMGLERHRIDILARESGLSPTVLRRRLSRVPAIKTPPWADGLDRARKLIPMALFGTWNREFDADRKILATLAENSYDAVEIAVAELYQLEDSPVWCIGKHRGVRSKIDTLFAIATVMTEGDLGKFFAIAEKVLSKSSTPTGPTGNDPPSQINFGEMSDHSAALRSGIRDTLVFLSVHGKDLFLERSEVNIEHQISDLVRRLLTPLTGEVLEFYNHDLPDFADAAPRVLLKILQEDLRQTESALQLLLQPINSNMFSSPPRTGILWALERLAWHQDHFMAVVNILAELSRTIIEDKWVNTPIKSLAAIFHSWLPQTSVSVEDRITALKSLCRSRPDIGWQICIRQIDYRNDIGEFSARPRWRSIGSMTPLSRNERWEFECAVLDIVIHWTNHNEWTLGDLLFCLTRVDTERQSQILDCVEKWESVESNNDVRGEVREKIGDILYMTADSSPGLHSQALRRAQDIFEKLIPNDPFERYALLFQDQKNYFPIAKAEDPTLTGTNWWRQALSIQKKVITEIWSSEGITGVLKLLSKNTSGYTLGIHAASQVLTPEQAADTVHVCLLTETISHEKIVEFLWGFFTSLDGNMCTEAVSSLLKNGTDEEIKWVLRYIPFSAQMWQLLDEMSENIRDQWWREANIPLREYREFEASVLVDNLLRVEREWDALSALRADYDRVGTSHLKRLLQGITEKEPNLVTHSNNDLFFLSNAMESLGKRSDISGDEMAELEFASLSVFPLQECKLPHLEKRLAGSPSTFIDYVLLITGSRKTVPVSEELNLENENLNHTLVRRAYKLFSALDRLPGQNDIGEIDSDFLMQWISEVRKLALEHGCIRFCDEQIGQWLSKNSTMGKDDQWPSRAICEVLESIHNDEISTGFRIGVFNARGGTVRLPYEGGGQERILVDKYRRWAKACRIEFPFVSEILNNVAERYEGEATWEDQRAGVRKYRNL